MLKQTKRSFYTVNEIRQEFLNYFKLNNHEIVPSSSLVPMNDPTLLFTNAGMVQFKEVFLGQDKRPYKTAASSQRCVRAGGKHNDLERVGHTARHHTFFEMLGNFSFGDYFKEEAIRYAWEFLTQILCLPPEKLWITVYKEDHDAADIWLNQIKIDPTRFSRCGEESNFWSMGATGPCGPCTEIFYDHGAHIAGGPPGSPDEDGDRYVEIWNLVFMQYDRSEDGTLTPLPKPSVDTGMGLERIAAVMQGVENNFDIDLFKHLIQATVAIVKSEGLFSSTPKTGEDVTISLRVIADHIRSTAFLMMDGVLPSNEGRGYVLRRIIRRALRHGNSLGVPSPFFYRLVKPLINEMGEAYPKLSQAQNLIEKTLKMEEEQFSLTLSQGLKLFEQAIQQLSSKEVPGDVVFKLYDTYGFPVDLTADIARERDLTIDFAGFEAAMEKQRQRSREASQFAADYHASAITQTQTEFLRHEEGPISKEEAKILAIYKDKQAVEELSAGDAGIIILDRTPFYAEAGGQIGDRGTLEKIPSTLEKATLFEVTDTQKQGQAYFHIGQLIKGKLAIGDIVSAAINTERRAATVLNHTATHLLHHVLHDTLGKDAIQKGSLVEPERLRFDFAYGAPLTKEQIESIEQKVNQAIRANDMAEVKETSLEEATANGAIALFEEKYGDTVRMVRFGDSVELCGGTHAHHTGDIGLFKITSESGVASGIRRIEAVTGQAALDWFATQAREHKEKLLQSEQRVQLLEKQIELLKAEQARSAAQDLLTKAEKVGHFNVLVAKLNNIEAKSLRTTVDQLKNKLGSAVIVLAALNEGKASLIVGITKDYTTEIKAGDLVNHLARQLGGKGGGRPDLAEASAPEIEHLDKALASVSVWLDEKSKK